MAKLTFTNWHLELPCMVRSHYVSFTIFTCHCDTRAVDFTDEAYWNSKTFIFYSSRMKTQIGCHPSLALSDWMRVGYRKHLIDLQPSIPWSLNRRQDHTSTHKLILFHMILSSVEGTNRDANQCIDRRRQLSLVLLFLIQQWLKIINFFCCWSTRVSCIDFFTSENLPAGKSEE
jgi:hypothetical protein